jgi:pimeloyl-ACP methyl ester carboxylesterase
LSGERQRQHGQDYTCESSAVMDTTAHGTPPHPTWRRSGEGTLSPVTRACAAPLSHGPAIRIIVAIPFRIHVRREEVVVMKTATAALITTAVRIPINGRVRLNAEIATPGNAKGIVLFAHGSGSGRFSPRNRYVASQLNFCELATVLADLLTDEEEKLDRWGGALRFDISLLTDRFVKMVDWARTQEQAGTLPIGVFGASTGSAAALDAAALRPDLVRAVVSRGGRPDLATHLAEVKAPTLLLVGSNDPAVLELNSEASRVLQCTKELEVIPGATHLFEEPGALEAVASAAGAWFHKYLNAVR